MLRNKKPKRHVSRQRREERPVAAGVDESWSMDFMSDELLDGRRIRFLTIVDNFTRESLAIRVEGSIRGQDIVVALQRLKEQLRLPRTIRVDNGPEFTSKRLDQWAYLNGVELDFSRSGKPTDNAFIEAFNEPVPAGMFERELVPVPGRRRGEGGVLAETLQWRKASQRAGKPVPQGVRRTSEIED